MSGCGIRYRGSELLVFELLSPEIEAFGDAFFHPVGGGGVVGASFGEVGLGGEVAVVVVGVEVLHRGFVGSGLFGEFFSESSAEMFGDGEGGASLDVFHRFAKSGVGGVGFGGGGEVDGGVGEGDSSFGHSDEFEGLLGGDGDLEG